MSATPSGSDSNLSSPYSSPEPSPPPARKPPTSTAKAAGLDSSSELSELTEDEQEGGSRASARSTTSKVSNGSSKRKRGGLVPEPMWDWAYKSRKTNGDDKSKRIGPPPDASPPVDQDEQTEDEGGDDDPPEVKPVADPPEQDEADEGGEPAGPKTEADAADDESHDEDFDEDDVPVPSPLKADNREGSTELTEVEDVEEEEEGSRSLSREASDVESEEESNAPSDNEPEEEDEPTPPEEVSADVDDELAVDAPVEGAAPVVPLAHAGSSIMAGQQLIKTPTPSPSTSPEPEEEPVLDVDAPDEEREAEAEAEASAEADAEPDVDVDLAENEPDVEAEAEIEEAESDLQPAHRAEALDVLAGIEMRFALLRERLYVEKMEELAVEEAMILQGMHPEMIHLQNELQVRHDRRLELAAKKRRYEDEHVSLMRKVEEEAIWSWWKHERDQLQLDMFAEANRKRRKLEREKRLIERPMPVRRLPPPPPLLNHVQPATFREILKSTSLEPPSNHHRPSRKRKIARFSRPKAFPSLPILSQHEIQTDLQFLATRRPFFQPSIMHDGTMGPALGGMGVGMMPPGREHVAHGEYAPNHLYTPYGHGIPGIPAPPQPPPHGLPPSAGPGRPYRQPPPPTSGPAHMLGAHHSRSMQGPGVHAGSAPPAQLGGYAPHAGRSRRSPSPPPVQVYPYNAMNGMSQYGGTSGPGQQGWMSVPSSSSKPPLVNGWGKDHRERRMASGGREVDGRERERERETLPERERNRDRERDGMWPDNVLKEEEIRMQNPLLAPSLQGQQPHRHNLQHHSSHGAPHQHYHIVHHHNTTHHHHSASRPSGSTLSQHASSRRHEPERYASIHETDASPPPRRHTSTIETITLAPKPSSTPYWQIEDGEPARDRERDRERDRARTGAAPSSIVPAPPPDRSQVTSFVMTPSQAMQGLPPPNGSPSRRDIWPDDPYRRPLHDPAMGAHPMMEPTGTRHPNHTAHAHIHSPSRHGSRGLNSPRRPQAPASPPMASFPSSSRLRSPSRTVGVGSAHASPHFGSATPKMSRPISPLPAKLISSATALAYGGGAPAGPGTPGLSGPGGRAPLQPDRDRERERDGVAVNGHGLPLSLFSPAPHMPLAGPDSPRLLQPKMSVGSAG